MSKGSMRDPMPVCAAILDDLRAVFGVEEMDAVVKRGLRPDCKPDERVYFSEAGHVLGQRAPEPTVAFTADQLEPQAAPVISKRKEGR